MATNRFLIAPIDQGQQNNVEPWLIMDNGFFRLRNAYNWRSRVKKRFGSKVMNGSKTTIQMPLFTRLRMKIGTTSNPGGNLAGNVPGVVFKVGQLFSIGDEVFTVTTAGVNQVMLTTGASATHTYSTTDGAYSFTGAAADTDVYFYPAEPVMNFGTYELVNINDEQIFAWDTQFAYIFQFATGWQREDREGDAGASEWTPGALTNNFYNISNYRGNNADDFLMFITNNVAADGFRYWDGFGASPGFYQLGTATTTQINAAGDYLVTARAFIPFFDRLLALAPTENIGGQNVTFGNRIRWCKVGSPITPDDSWRDDIVGHGGFLDAPVNEYIVGAGNLNNILVIGFERSHFRFSYQNNELDPFRFDKIDSTKGIESINSIISFDRDVKSFGQTGITECNGQNVYRIDNEIPDTIFDISNDNSGPQRVAGIQDFPSELIYWSYPSTDADTGTNNTYPNRVLVYDYRNKTWSYNDDSITAFGSYYVEENVVWQDIDQTWEEMEQTWNDPSFQDQYRSVIGGNQEGFTFIVSDEINVNSLSLQITNITYVGSVLSLTIIDHNLPDTSFIKITGVNADGGNMADLLNNKIFKAYALSSSMVSISTMNVNVTGNYTGGGNAALRSKIDILTKQYNFYNKIGSQMACNRVDFYVDKTSTEEIDGVRVGGQVQIDYFLSSSSISTVRSGINNGSLVGTGILETSPFELIPLEETQDRFWHPMYIVGSGENIQLRIYMNDEQMLVPIIAEAPFQLNAMLFYVQKTSDFGA